MIKIEHLNKYYNKNKTNENHVINDMSVVLPETGLVTFFGPSGCGKTTLLNVIGCLDTFDSGTITYFDFPISKYVPSVADELRNRLIGYIFQNYNLLDSMSVYNNVKIPLEMLGIKDEKEIDRRVKYCLDAVGMLNYRKRNVLALSGGQRQRVAIARALVKNPKIIIADEPTGNLDSNNTFDVMNIIKKISKDRLVILVSHEKDMVEFYSDRIIELKDGVIVSDVVNQHETNLKHSDVRNIYLKDYEKKDYKDDKVDLTIYDDHTNNNVLNMTIVFRNGEIFLDERDGKKINVLNNFSEIKLLDASEVDYKKSLEKEENTSFDISNLGPISSDSKKRGGFIPLKESIGMGFTKSRRFVKRGVFTYLALIISSLVFALLLGSIVSIFNFKESDYLKTSRNTVSVNLTKKDTKNGLNANTIYESVKNVDGFISMSGQDYFYSGSLSINCTNYYQTMTIGNSTMVNIYPVNGSKYPYELLEGTKIVDEKDVVIGKWVADNYLKSSSAKNNGITSYSDMIGMKTIFYSNDLSVGEFKIVGVSNEESTATVFSSKIYALNMTYRPTSSVIVIDGTNKKAIIEALSKYSSVVDTEKDGKKEYIGNLFEENLSKFITMAVMALAIFIYLALMIRSSMFKKIKDIGILRSVGARKKDIVSIFTGEMISLTLVTSFIVFSIVSLLIVIYNHKSSLAEMGLKVLDVTWWSYLIGIFLLFFVNILSGILPIISLMHKTPVEIIKKYDI